MLAVSILGCRPGRAFLQENITNEYSFSKLISVLGANIASWRNTRRSLRLGTCTCLAHLYLNAGPDSFPRLQSQGQQLPVEFD